MGIELDCSKCSNCDLSLFEKQNEISRQFIESPGKIKRDNIILNIDYKDKRLEYYNKNIPQIIFLQLRVKKFLNHLKQDSDPRDAFYNKNYGTYEISNDNLDIISEKNEDNNNGLKTEENHHQIKHSKEQFKTLSHKYSTLNNYENNVIEINKPYKVENYQINDLAIYSGDMLNGKQHGYGIQTWNDGARYEGQWNEGKTNGYGKFIHPDGDIYEGYWKDDKANGHGVYTTINNVKYDGEWLDDCQHGYGEEIWNDGSKYKGYYKNGKKHGIGEYSWIDGSKYIGNWVDNNQEGYGEYIWNDNKSYEGYFKNNALQGEGHLKWTDGREYFGSFNKGKRQGLGKYLWADKRSYTGFWEKGKQSGLGLYVNEENEKRFGIWLNGKRNRWLTEEEINSLKEISDIYYYQIINFDISKYKFIEEKNKIETIINRMP